MADEAFVVHEDVCYGAEDRDYWRLDLALPRTPVRGPAPAVLFIHGGGWRSCHKRESFESAMIRHFAGRGYVAASVEYRLTDVAPFPAQFNDVRCAVRFLRANAETYGLDPNHIGAVGHSAGGHLAAMLGTVPDESWLDGADPAYGEYSAKVQAVVPLAGAFDLRVMAQPLADGTRPRGAIADLLPGPTGTLQDRALLASPVHYVDEATAAFLIIHGREDPTCPFAQAEAFMAKLRSCGVDADMMSLEGRGHMVIEDEEIVPRMEEFFDRALGGQVTD
jgi:acetyl esterase/lipase